MPDPRPPFRVMTGSAGAWESNISTLRRAIRSAREAIDAGCFGAIYDVADQRIGLDGEVKFELDEEAEEA